MLLLPPPAPNLPPDQTPPLLCNSKVKDVETVAGAHETMMLLLLFVVDDVAAK